ncbi:NAD(P)H dehydrogenase [Pleomorphomonas diazotrophica]|uniref:NAD(P)H dehydrogenase n=1 Tax=Pleomorphomonas diazotrophica TaxID=1166257 RepID=A0A1I4VZJ2_9HYPH|nr:NAD(P)H-dependent oxidoreductase [Pleomorphomonas diazotrophica]PKR88260.1 NAD(P)H dehydrogenase [Pleomorphomonas diazotrophica]SFN06590.1 Putative NADPH-quinone reductase (modulator of drug activity B) [Pleomorphomonas diazotrophica]
MKCLVVVAHPLPDSLCRSLARFATERLEAAGHQVTVEDLYGSGFDAALTEAERRSYYAAAFDASAVADEAARLTEAEALVLVFPTWWYGFPAILKGWFDRVWAPGIAFDHGADFGPIKPRLGLRHVLAITTLGSPWWIDTLVLWQPVRRILRIAILGACARGVRFNMLSLHSAEKPARERVARLETRIASILDRWPAA